MKLGIDAHFHPEHIENIEEVLEEVRERMVAAVASVPDPKDALRILELRKKFHDCLFVCLGFHPEIAFNYSDYEIEDYINIVKQHRKEIVGIGEIGLDYNWTVGDEKIDKTKEFFSRFIELAKELKLPVVIHTRNSPIDRTRNAVDDALDTLEQQGVKDAVMHCYSGNEKQMERALVLGYWISFATIIARSDKHKRLARLCPLDRMLLETDAPWLDPDSTAGTKELTNRPWKIERSAEIIAEIKGTTKEDVMKATTENARKAFGV